MAKRELQEAVEEILKEIGNEITTLRKQKGMNQKDFGLSQNLISNLELGKGSTLKTLVTVLDRLDVMERVIDAINMRTEEDKEAARRKTEEAAFSNTEKIIPKGDVKHFLLEGSNGEISR